MAFSLNIHEFYNDLKNAGFTEQQAEVIANIQNKTASAAIEQTKHDFRLDDITTNKDLDIRIKETELKIELVQRDIEVVRKEIADSKADLIKWIIGSGFTLISVIFMMLRFFEKM
jgi:lipoate synthase